MADETTRNKTEYVILAENGDSTYNVIGRVHAVNAISAIKAMVKNEIPANANKFVAVPWRSWTEVTASVEQTTRVVVK